MCHNRKTILFILSALLQQLTLGSTHSTKTEGNLKVTAPTPKNEISYSSKSSPTKTYYDTDPSQESVTSPTKTDNLENSLSHKIIPSSTTINTVDNDKFQENETSSTKTNNPNNDFSHGSIGSQIKIYKTDYDLSKISVTSLSETYNPENYQSHQIIPSSTTINNSEKQKFQGSATSPTEPDNPEHGSLTSLIQINNQEYDRSNGSNPLPSRRQNPGQSKPFRPPSDSKIANLLNKYRGLVKKHGAGNLPASSEGAKYDSQDQHDGPLHGDNIEKFYIGKRGPIRHTPRRPNLQSASIARDGKEEKPTSPSDSSKPQPSPGEPETTQNEAQGAASRFTARTTTTHRRRRTAPKRVSLTEDCDYRAYYCLKAYETGKICAMTLYYNTRTFQNYCLLDYVNCVERYDIWTIIYMGECFTLKDLTEYKFYPYQDEKYLENYYVIDDV